MSSTGRGFERRKDDYYATPSWCVDWLLPMIDLPGGRWLEPGAGDGAIIRAVSAHRRDIAWTAVELDSARAANMLVDTATTVLSRDFLETTLPEFSVAIGNPPFHLAQEFVEHAMRQAREVVFLLRLNFLGSQKRRAFFSRVGMPDVFVLSKRPAFIVGAGTDSCEYAWFRWPQSPRKRGSMTVLYGPDQGALL